MPLTLYERIKLLCEKNNIKISQLEKTLGFGNAIIVNWKSSVPSSDKIAKVASYFDVTTDYLMGLTETPYKVETTNDRDLKYIQLAREQMSDTEKDKMMQLLKISYDYIAWEEMKNENKI